MNVNVADKTKMWVIDRYARMNPSNAPLDGQWKYYDDTITPLLLTVGDFDVMVLSQGTVVLESFNLKLNSSTLRGLVRTDSLLVAYKSCKTTTRPFRLRFKPHNGKTGAQVCEECVSHLSRFFVIKKHTSSISTAPTTAQASSSSIVVGTPATAVTTTTVAANKPTGQVESVEGDTMMEQELTFGQVAKCVLTEQSLGMAYQTDQEDTLRPLDSPSMQQLVRLCLLDPGFPSFVTQVQTALDTVIHSHTTSK